MGEQNTAAFGIYSDRLSTTNAIEKLRSAGFRNEDIVTLFPDELGAWQYPATSHKKLWQGALAGAGLGLLLAGALSWVLSSMSLVSFGVTETFIALIAIGTLGGLSGAWVGRRISEYETRYERRVRRGDILISVQCDDDEWSEKAKEILKRTGADDVSASDRLTVEFVRTNRILVRAASERSSAAPLRLVRQKSTWLETGGVGRIPATSRRLRRTHHGS
jgi:hypothetical protein